MTLMGKPENSHKTQCGILNIHPYVTHYHF